MFQQLEKNGEPGGDRRRHPERKRGSYSFCDVQEVLDALNLRDWRKRQYAWSTRPTPPTPEGNHA